MDDLFETIADGALGKPTESISLAGFQVTRAEFFANMQEPTLTIWPGRIKFSMSCIKNFPGVTHIQILVNDQQHRLVIRPSEKDKPDALRWAKGGSAEEIRSRDMTCRMFSAKVYEMMTWSPLCRYRIVGVPAVCEGEALFLFRLNDCRAFVSGKNADRNAFFPKDWRDYFGLPVEKHEESHRIDLADGYISTATIRRNENGRQYV